MGCSKAEKIAHQYGALRTILEKRRRWKRQCTPVLVSRISGGKSDIADLIEGFGVCKQIMMNGWTQ
jgi:hypothetical protein